MTNTNTNIVNLITFGEIDEIQRFMDNFDLQCTKLGLAIHFVDDKIIAIIKRSRKNTSSLNNKAIIIDQIISFRMISNEFEMIKIALESSLPMLYNIPSERDEATKFFSNLESKMMILNHNYNDMISLFKAVIDPKANIVTEIYRRPIVPFENWLKLNKLVDLFETQTNNEVHPRKIERNIHFNNLREELRRMRESYLLNDFYESYLPNDSHGSYLLNDFYGSYLSNDFYGPSIDPIQMTSSTIGSEFYQDSQETEDRSEIILEFYRGQQRSLLSMIEELMRFIQDHPSPNAKELKRIDNKMKRISEKSTFLDEYQQTKQNELTPETIQHFTELADEKDIKMGNLLILYSRAREDVPVTTDLSVHFTEYPPLSSPSSPVQAQILAPISFSETRGKYNNPPRRIRFSNSEEEEQQRIERSREQRRIEVELRQEERRRSIVDEAREYYPDPLLLSTSSTLSTSPTSVGITVSEIDDLQRFSDELDRVYTDLIPKMRILQRRIRNFLKNPSHKIRTILEYNHLFGWILENYDDIQNKYNRLEGAISKFGSPEIILSMKNELDRSMNNLREVYDLYYSKLTPEILQQVEKEKREVDLDSISFKGNSPSESAMIERNLGNRKRERDRIFEREKNRIFSQ